MDITSLIELKIIKNIYLFNILEHFSKYGISYIFENKESNNIFEKSKLHIT